MVEVRRKAFQMSPEMHGSTTSWSVFTVGSCPSRCSVSRAATSVGTCRRPAWTKRTASSNSCCGMQQAHQVLEKGLVGLGNKLEAWQRQREQQALEQQQRERERRQRPGPRR